MRTPNPTCDFCPRLTSSRVTEASEHSVASRTSVSARSARNVAACPRRAQSGAVTLTREPEANGSWAAIWVEALPKMQMRTKVIEHPEPATARFFISTPSVRCECQRGKVRSIGRRGRTLVMSSAWEDQTEVNIRVWAGRRKQKPCPKQADGHLRTLGVGVSLSDVGVGSLLVNPHLPSHDGYPKRRASY